MFLLYKYTVLGIGFYLAMQQLHMATCSCELQLYDAAFARALAAQFIKVSYSCYVILVVTVIALQSFMCMTAREC